MDRGEIMKQCATSSWILRVVLSLAVGLPLLSVTALHAQVDTGSISGVVTDASGAVIRDAEVTLTNEGTNAQLSTKAGTDGRYVFSPVRIGSYTLGASYQGFQKTEQKNVKVDVGAAVVANFELRPGAATETVEVNTTAPVLQTQEASVGQVLDTRNVNSLPLNGRNFTFLAQLAAGVNNPQADTRGNAASGAFSANGLRPAQNNYMLDGIDNNSDTVDFLNGTNYVVLPPVDAIQEFKVQTSGFSAEYGRSGAAVLNATIKSGTNSFHGAGWEFFRNDALDGADYFETQHHIRKGELRQNQFGAAIGGPIIKNKVFIFGDYEQLQRFQGTILTGSVPTLAERNSGYKDLSDLITGQNSPARPDYLGRSIPVGTILDPATTRAVTAGAVDPTSGITALKTGYVRDPFGTCGPGTTTFTLATCGLNQLPAGRLDPNAIKLLNLYPNPSTSSTLFNNYANSPLLTERRKAFDTRMDINFNDKNQMFYRFSYVDDPDFIPGIFGGVPDGGGFQQGNQTALAQQSALAYTHVFSPTAVNVARAGLNYLHTTRVSPAANQLTDIPSTFGIQGIPQQHENGGLPAFGINGLTNLGSNAFLPSDEVSSTIQVTDDFTKIYGKHTFKMGFEYQHVKFSTLQPPWSRGEFDYNGDYTDVANVDGGSTGRAQFLLTPTAHNPAVTNGIDFVGGSTNIYASNISLTDNGKNYSGAYVQDDWNVTPKLTLNLGVRWDFFGLVYEHHGNQANFVPSGPPTGAPMYLIPSGPNSGNLSSGPNGFTTLLAQDGIALKVGNSYGKGLGTSQKANFAPRVGFAYQVTPKFVARGGFGMFYNGFENRGFSPNLGENYPFQFNFNYSEPNQGHPVSAGTPFAGCATAGPGGTATFESGFSCIPLSPLSVNATGLGLRGIQFDYITPYSMSGNFTLQYAVTPTLSVQAGYVTSLGRHLEVFPNSNNVTQILPANLPNGLTLNDTGATTLPVSQGGLPFPDFGAGSSYAITEGSSYYHGLQTKVEKQFSNGLNFLATYTWSKVLSDAHDLLNGGSVNNQGASNINGYRAPSVVGMGIRADYGLSPFDVRNVVHLSGGYELPFGKNKRFLSNAGGVANALAAGWSVNWAATLQGGQPITVQCPTQTATSVACDELLIGDPKTGLHTDANGQLSWFGNQAAWAQPCVLGGSLGATAPIAGTPTGCIPLTGKAALGGGPSQVPGPGFHRLDFSSFKDFQINERFRLQFRAEFFNILNHPNFNAPGFGGNGVVSITNSLDPTKSNFGEIGSTRDAPYDPRQIQFALKLYY
jgi:Carboxypeptidase regulatory-like domain/TonB dependent receptor/TonB-dependent Receptor Plug Domain